MPAGSDSQHRAEIPPLLCEGANQNENPQRRRTIPVEEFYINFARAVFSVTLPAAATDFEFDIQTKDFGGGAMAWPATAPALNQTVVAADLQLT